MNRYDLIFLSSFAIFTFFLTPNINTGDGGELATAAWFLGTAHPSGYPLYLMIGKTFTFFPLGNIAFRTAIISALFSSLSLTLIYWLMLRLTSNSAASLFAVTVLLVSYSYFSQSVVAKFYMLNLFLILLLFTLWATRVNSAEHEAVDKQNGPCDTQLLYFTMFIAGLITANHHTGIIILCPVAVACFLTKNYRLKFSTIFTGIALFMSGFFTNSYLIIRGSADHFFNAQNIDDFIDFYKVVTRQVYGDSSTIASTNLLVHGFTSYWYALKNFLSILTSNFSYFSYALFLVGFIYLIRKNPKLFIFIFISLTMYGPALAKLTLVSKKQYEIDYYITANQYFIPAISFFIIVLAIGFHHCEEILKDRGLKLLSKLLPVTLALFPLVFLVSRATDSDYRTDFVPYQLAKDTYSVLPPDSVIMTFGDNASYQGWYLKLVGRYREDICQIASGNQKTIDWMFQGCDKKIYGTVFPMFYSRKFNELVPMILKYRYYGTDPIKDKGAYKQYLCSDAVSIDYLYLPREVFTSNRTELSKDAGSFLSRKQLAADKVINPSVCLTHFTDDLFSRQLCSSYVIHLTNIARLYSEASYHRTGEKVKVQARDMRSGYTQPLYTVDVTEKNRPYLELSTHILRFNKWPILYMRKKE